MEKVRENNVLFSVETAKKQNTTSLLCCCPSRYHTGMQNELASSSGEGIRSRVVARGPAPRCLAASQSTCIRISRHAQRASPNVLLYLSGNNIYLPRCEKRLCINIFQSPRSLWILFSYLLPEVVRCKYSSSSLSHLWFAFLELLLCLAIRTAVVVVSKALLTCDGELLLQNFSFGWDVSAVRLVFVWLVSAARFKWKYLSGSC